MKDVVKIFFLFSTIFTMISVMRISVFADNYAFVGDVRLFNESDDSNKEIGWIPTAVNQELKYIGNGLYIKKFVCKENGD